MLEWGRDDYGQGRGRKQGPFGELCSQIHGGRRVRDYGVAWLLKLHKIVDVVGDGDGLRLRTGQERGRKAI